MNKRMMEIMGFNRSPSLSSNMKIIERALLVYCFLEKNKMKYKLSIGSDEIEFELKHGRFICRAGTDYTEIRSYSRGSSVIPSIQDLEKWINIFGKE